MAQSPAAWLKVLEGSLDRQARACKLYEDYYDGNHRLQFATDKFRQAFGALLKAFADNWCELIVDASVERLEVQGFRFGKDQSADDDAWGIWQDNNLDADSMLAHTEAVKCGASYLLIEPPAGNESPAIYTEHPSQMIVAHAPGNRRVRQAALKKWQDDDGYLMATLYLPDSIHKWRSQNKATNGGRVDWREREAPARNSLEEVPVVPLYNNPSMKGGGRSDLLSAIPLQDAINKLVCDVLVDSETIALPQRVLIGVEVPRDPVTNLPLPSSELKAIRSKLWAFANEKAKVEQLEGGDLSKSVGPIEMLLAHMAAVTRMPIHYMLARVVNVSDKTLKGAETGLVKKVERKKIHFEDGWEDGMRLAFKAAGDEKRAAERRLETIWGDSETRSEGERTDALVKKRQSLDVPREVIWEEAGYTPTQIARMKAMEEHDALLAAALGDSGEPNPGDQAPSLPEPAPIAA